MNCQNRATLDDRALMASLLVQRDLHQSSSRAFRSLGLSVNAELDDEVAMDFDQALATLKLSRCWYAECPGCRLEG